MSFTYSVLNLKQDLTSVSHGTTLNKIQNVDGLIDRAARQLMLDVDPQETIRIIPLPQVFQQVYDYPCPPDLKGNKVIDIRPQPPLPRPVADEFAQSYNQTFDRTRTLFQQNQFTINFNTAVKSLRVAANSFVPS